ncbi:serine/threonine-protein kinase [Methylibium rhizosphaerae]|jgi:serine/threonine protein kinase|uniref:serine/threonine-protein kinase n=1 Tax=Methylibium rhizosphaerae TaxID=2570323 RepID=UPI001127384F|nr:serine/threonine-protein kinase [Methylibium rhizosphaerae]
MNIPERLGKYPVIGVLGRGAMGTVYLATDPVIKRRVAVKTIRKELIDDDDKAETMSGRFRREAQAAGALNHPGIVGVYEYGEDEQFAFIAMEYVEGNTLREYLSRGVGFDERDTVSIMAQLLDALEFAHRNSIWHRDIKPANIIIMSNGRIKLADFGIARIENADRTRANLLMGTPGYIAPEYYLGEHIDHRIDIFAAGVLLYELLALQAPFRGRPEAIMHDVCYHDPQPPSEVDPRRRWPQYDAVVARALAKNPAQRYQTADAFRAALLAEYAHPVSSTISEATIISNVVRPIGVDPTPSGPRAPSLGSNVAPGSSSGGTSSPPPTGWSAPVLSGVEMALARFVGPVARVLVRKAAHVHKDIDSLTASLMESLDRAEDREAFARAVTGRPVTLPPTVVNTRDGNSSPGSVPPGQALTPADVERAAQLLTAYIGPIAKVVTKRAAGSCSNRNEFFKIVAQNLDNDAQRERFLREAGAA